MATSTRPGRISSLGHAVWHVTVVIPVLLALLCGLWAYALRPPPLPDPYLGSLMYIKTDPPSPVNLMLKVGEFEDFSLAFFGFTWPGGSPRAVPHKITLTVELGGLKPGTHWIVVICGGDIGVREGIATRAPEKADFPEVEVSFGDMPCGTEGRALTGVIPGNGGSNSKGFGDTITLADISYRLPNLVAWDPSYLAIAAPSVAFYSHFPSTEREREAQSNSHIQETFSPIRNSVPDYIPYIGPTVARSDGTWTWNVDPYPFPGSAVTALDVKQERETQRGAFYSGVLFGVAASTLIAALSQTLTRLTTT